MSVIWQIVSSRITSLDVLEFEISLLHIQMYTYGSTVLCLFPQTRSSAGSWLVLVLVLLTLLELVCISASMSANMWQGRVRDLYHNMDMHVHDAIHQ